MTLDGADALACLATRLSGHATPGDAHFADPAHNRLWRAAGDPRATALDIAVLIRHVLLLEAGRRPTGLAPSLPVPSSMPLAAIAAAGLRTRPGGDVETIAWHPEWLEGIVEGLEPDAAAARAVRRRFGVDAAGPLADPFLGRLGHDRYRSVGQRAALRAAMLTPAGSTTVVDLPTGEGKSLIFQAIDEIGFASAIGDDNTAGVTLVVVPTVGLAYDHEARCRRAPGDVLAYVGGGSPERRIELLRRLNELQSGLVFAAPEAVCRSLREPLKRAARAGRLKALVVDEAHLIDAWGTGFRPDFQTLAGFRTELIGISPSRRAPRTILLSATLTPETLDTLGSLYADAGRMEIVSAAQVRPEHDHWVASACDETEQVSRVTDALSKVPRPAVLYVTEVAAARAWATRLKALGYGRVATFHGQTPDADRIAILERWSGGDLDVVVATSAFGLGIDYAHVRSIVHACVPETFDRFYQEVGRAGRDGCAALSLVIPASKDFKVAEGLNRERVISVERGLERWTAMFNHADRRHLGGTRFHIRLDVSPGYGADDIDMVGERSVQWNARTITLLARAGLLRLIGADRDGTPEERDRTYQAVEVLDPGHLLADVWQRRVEPVRAAIAKARTRNLELMTRRLHQQPCPADLVLELYGGSKVDVACASCRICRAVPAQRHPTALRREPGSPWSLPPFPGEIADLLDGGRRLAVTYDPEAGGLQQRRRATQALDGLWRAGLRCLVLLGDPPPLFARGLESLRDQPVFIARRGEAESLRLPGGPRVVLVGPGHPFRRPMGVAPDARLLLIPKSLPDPERRDELMLDRWQGTVITLDNLIARLLG